MNDAPGDRAFGHLLGMGVTVAVPLGFVMALDGERWPVFSAVSILIALLMTLMWRASKSIVMESLAALAWVTALIPSLRWLALPFVLFPLLALATIGLPFVIWGELRRRERQRRDVGNACLACGYDLRASSERCPECGAAIDNDAARRRRVAEELATQRNGDHRRRLRFHDLASPGRAAVDRDERSIATPNPASDDDAAMR